MIKSKFYNKEELKEFYNKFKENKLFMGYIQLSDSRITEDKLFLTPKILPDFDNVVSTSKFIYEASFFDKESNISTLIRQIDDKWLVSVVDLNEKDEKTEIEYDYFIAKTKNMSKIKIAHIWQEQEDDLCENMSVLKHVYSAFVGFEGGKND